ncbi:adiponectin receptor protein-like isoform X2 [Anneissia japonica]|uniref:adiponectin receptor protein-like isoform X2 n=1 Tax=Anneissia japonica TaxID=1529436 RepID=UPI001425587A|nr:adiponectin receptor protein-like isoform X2 [Anneissia japonica]
MQNTGNQDNLRRRRYSASSTSSSDEYDSDIDPTYSECDVDMITFPLQAVKAGRRAAGEAAKRAAEAAGRAKERASEAAGRVSERAHEAAGRVSERAHEAAERVSERAHEVAERAGRMKDKAAEAAANTAENAKRYGRKVKEAFVWKATHFNLLPSWLKDNEFLHNYHRPQLPSFKVCFKSMFRIHTETGNIWTHLLGCIAFFSLMIYYLVSSILADIQWQEITVYMAFFIGAIVCMGFSWIFHTCYCHSREAAQLFSKLDYSGITILIVGSFVPWLYFGFYCDNLERYIYIGLIVILGAIAAVVALRDKFSTPAYRPIRAGVFITLGLSALIPAIHYVVLNGFAKAIEGGSLQWMVLMGALYIGGAVLYAVRVPERLFPGKCDIWFQSHQIFHVMVIAAAFVHYHGLNVMAKYRAHVGECDAILGSGTDNGFMTTMTQTVF